MALACTLELFSLACSDALEKAIAMPTAPTAFVAFGSPTMAGPAQNFLLQAADQSGLVEMLSLCTSQDSTIDFAGQDTE